jgi:hypothetical protein
MALGLASDDGRIAQLAQNLLGREAEDPPGPVRPGPYPLSLVGDVQAVCRREPSEPWLIDERGFIDVDEAPLERRVCCLDEGTLRLG